MNEITLSTGSKMPILGLGTWKSPVELAEKAVEYALSEASYNNVDCAAIYQNEKGVGAAFKRIFGGRRERKDVFVTSKLGIRIIEKVMLPKHVRKHFRILVLIT